MNPEEESTLREAYPGAADAVALHELIFNWQFITSNPRNTVDSVLKSLLKSADLAIENAPSDPTNPQSIAYIRPQMDHPDFARYLRAKLGAL